MSSNPTLPPAVALLLMQYRRPDGNTERARRAIQAAEMAWLERNNPVYPCIAFAEARTAWLPVPEWVLKYLDGAMDKARAVAGRTPQIEISQAIGDAFGFKSAGAGTVFTRADDLTWVHWGWLVDRKIGRGDKPYVAVRRSPLAATSDTSPSESTVRRAWQRYRQFVSKSPTW